MPVTPPGRDEDQKLVQSGPLEMYPRIPRLCSPGGHTRVPHSGMGLRDLLVEIMVVFQGS